MFYFTRDEFCGWYELMSHKLLVRLEFVRVELDCPVILSKADGAMGRRLGPNSESQHNFDKWGEIRAVDGFIPNHVTYKEFFHTAVKAGFTGIGLYAGWSSGKPGFHLDVRPSTGHVDSWSAQVKPVNGVRKNVYSSVQDLLHLDNESRSALIAELLRN